MIWNSIVLMSLFDLIIVSVVIYTAHVFYKRRQAIHYFRATFAVSLMLAGLGIIALFYLADLFTMFVLPLLIPMQEAMAFMEQLHLNLLWFVIVVGISLLVFGVSRLIHEVIPTHISLLEGLRDKEQHLTRLASTDPLTGLANRRLFFDEVDRLILHPDHNRHGFALLFLDLDGFKPINDSDGHEVGDLLLQQVAGTIQDTVRRADTAARYGGDEFVICLRGIDSREGVRRIAGQILNALASPIEINSRHYTLGASIGIALYPQHGKSGPLLVERADAAMYEVKRSGGNSIRFYQG